MKFFCPDIGHTTAAGHTSVAANFCPDVLLSYCLRTMAPTEECACMPWKATHTDSGQAADLGRYCYHNLLVWNSVCWTESHSVALHQTAHCV